jgi:hypothetical protein
MGHVATTRSLNEDKQQEEMQEGGGGDSGGVDAGRVNEGTFYSESDKRRRKGPGVETNT